MNDDSRESQVEMLRRRIAELEGQQSSREQPQQALHAAVESTLAATQAGLVIIDAEFGIHRLVSKTWAHRGEPLGRRCYEYFHGRGAPCPDCPAVEALRTHQTVVREMTLFGAKARTFQVAARAFQDEQGHWLVAEVALDITERLRAQEGLRTSEADFRSLFENSPTGIYRTTPDGRIVMANPALVRMLGYRSFEALAARNIEEEGFLPDYPRTRFKALIEKEGEIRDFEAVWTRQDGTSIVARENARIVRDGQGNVLYYEGTVQDVTELKKAEEATRESRANLQTVFDAMDDLLFIVAQDGRILQVNPAVTKRLGYTEAELVGIPVVQVHPPDRQAEAARVLADLLSGKGDVCLVPLMAKDGTIIPVETRVTRGQWSGRDVLFGLSRDISQRARTEAMLRESEEKYRALVESAGAGIFTMNEDGVYLFMNTTGAQRLGLRPQDVPGKTMWDLFPRKIADLQFEALRKAILSGQAMALESLTEIRGEPRFYSISIQPLRPVPGQPRTALVIATDITHVKQAEKALQQSEAVNRALLDATTDRALLIDVDGTLIAINETGAKAFHRTPEEMIGRNVYDLLPHDLAKTRVATNAEAIRTGRPIRAEDQRDGRILDNRVYPIFDSEGKAFRLAIYARDITEQKLAQEALRQSREQLQYVIDNSRDVIFQTDLEGNYIFASKSAEALTGRPLSELLSLNMRDLVPPEQLPILLERYRRRRAGLNVEQPFYCEMVHKDGHRVPTELVTTPVYRDGKLVAIQGIARDITERKRAEEALRTAHQKLTIAREEEGRALARELHDSIGQRLVVLQLAIQNADTGRAKPAGSARLRAITGQCRELIREVRHMSHGLYPPTLESLGLAAALRELGQGCQGAGKGCAVRITRKLAAARFPDPVEIALYRIAQESTHNAIRHGRADRIEIRLDYREGQARLKVTDNGVGFDPSDMTRNGLGLTTMLERAEAVGGQLTITSAPGRTCLEARVPASLRQNKPHPDAAPRRTPGRAIRKPRRPDRKKES